MDKERPIAGRLFAADSDTLLGYMYEGQYIIDQKAEDSEKRIKFGEDVGYVKSFSDALFLLAIEADLTKNQAKIVMCIPKYLRYNTGMIAHTNGIPFKVDDFAEKLKMPIRSVYDSIDNLILKGVICKVKILDYVEYYANPFIFTKGQYINDTLYSQFRNTKWAKEHEALCEKYTKDTMSG